MTIVGNRSAQTALRAAMAGGAMHHAWLIAGPEGVGKASFAKAAAMRMLAESAGTQGLSAGFDVPPGDRTRSLIEAGSHPDFRLLHRLPKDAEKPDQDIARSITIAQIRRLQPMFATVPSMGAARIIVIDAIDDLERAGANALLKNLEEPPSGTIFLLVSHAPGRLLPTIRSRCRLLRFEALTDDDTASAIRSVRPEASDDEVAALVRASDGSPGRGLRFAGLDIAGLDSAIDAIAADGDPDNARRVTLAKALGVKAAQPRYEAFLDRTPTIIARLARTRQGAALVHAIDAQARARDLSGAAIGLSLDPQATVFEMAGIVAGLHGPGPAR